MAEDARHAPALDLGARTTLPARTYRSREARTPSNIGCEVDDNSGPKAESCSGQAIAEALARRGWFNVVVLVKIA